MDVRPTPDSVSEICGKAILFASRRMFAPASVGDMAREQSERAWPELADLPAVGTPIEPGSPVLTVLASGETETQVIERLNVKLADTRRMLEADCT
jgi:predicted ATP-grasp superfamily ATP-dependent carboligase